MTDESAHSSGTHSEVGEISGGALTQILNELRHGDEEARARLVALVYEDLRELAAGHLARERAGHTLQPTALVNEAFLRLFGASSPSWENRSHFFGAAAEAMRRILVDFARRRQAKKRGGGSERVELDEAMAAVDAVDDDRAATVLAVDGALNGLGAHDERKRKLVELRFFLGMTMEEAADLLGVSLATAKRDWAFARAWLFHELGQRE